MKITITNDYHNTETVVAPRPITEGRYKGYHRISKQVARRLHEELCGYSGDCACTGDTFGARGRQEEHNIEIINMDYYQGFIVRIITTNQG